MVNFTREDIANRVANAEYKKAYSLITGEIEYSAQARLDMHVVEVMSKSIKDSEVDINEFLR
jgi:hypothetical protein